MFIEKRCPLFIIETGCDRIAELTNPIDQGAKVTIDRGEKCLTFSLAAAKMRTWHPKVKEMLIGELFHVLQLWKKR